MDFLLYLALVPALGVSAQWLAWRTNLPSILLLLLFGIVLGQFVQLDALMAERTGGDEHAGPNVLFPLVSLSVAVIMFEGGLSLKLSELRESGSATLRLVTIGALITFVLSAIAAHYVLDFAWRVSLLLGAILVVTGPTVIGPLLRQVRPSRRVASTLKWEGIVIDPVGAVLASLVYEQGLVNVGASPAMAVAISSLVWTAVVGLVLGAAGGAALTQLFRRFLVPDNLQGVASLATALLTYAISNHLAHESGLITVTVLGMWLTNQRMFDVEQIIEFKENLRTLLIGCLFIVLGSRINLGDIAEVGFPGVAMVLILILVIRPLSVYISLFKSPLNLREQTFVAGLAPRGIVAAAVSSVFALDLQSRSGEYLPGANQLATVTFMAIVGTVAVYGIAAQPLARLLKLADEKDHGILMAGADAWVRALAKELVNHGVPVMLVDSNFNKISQARVEGLNAVCANILNEHAIEDLDLTGIGRLIALTPNDEVNSLALRECRGLFDSSRLYQLTFKTKNTSGRRGLTKNLMGRELFGAGLTFTRIRDLYEAGATFKATKLTETFTYAEFGSRHSEQTILLAVLKADGTIRLNTVDDPLVPVAGQTVVTLASSSPVPHVEKTTDHA